MSQDCKKCGRTFRRLNERSGDPEKCRSCNEAEREAAVGRYCPSLIRERILNRKMLDCRDAVARRLKTGSGLSA